MLALQFLQSVEAELLVERLQERIEQFLETGQRQSVGVNIFLQSGAREDEMDSEERNIEMLLMEDGDKSEDEDNETEVIDISSGEEDEDEEDMSPAPASNPCSAVKLEHVQPAVQHWLTDTLAPHHDEEEDNSDDEDYRLIKEITVKENLHEDQFRNANIAKDTQPSSSSQDKDIEGEESDESLRTKNLIPSFDELQLCRLCFLPYNDEAGRAGHEEAEHGTDQTELERDSIILQDLVVSCDLCPEIPGFLSHNIMVTHKRLQHKLLFNKKISNTPKTFQCNLCYLKMSSNWYVKTHKNRVHKDLAHLFDVDLSEDELKSKCNKCELKFLTEGILKQHLRTHVELKSCRLCYINCEDESLLKSHEPTHIQDKLHLTKEIRAEELKEDCDQCDLKFLSEELLKYHKRLVHPRRNECILCYSSFKTYHEIKIHLLRNHREEHNILISLDVIPQEIMKFQCHICKLKFVSNSVLSYHKRRDHGEKIQNPRKPNKKEKIQKPKKPNKQNENNCKLCYALFKTKQNLQMHIMRNHKEERKFISDSIIITPEQLISGCSKCELRFVSDSVMRYHKYRHHGERSGRLCKLCDWQFPTKERLSSHKKRVHLKEMDAFDRDIDREEMIHECFHCTKKFFSEISMKFHRRKLHPKNVSQSVKSISDKLSQRFCNLCHVDFKTFQRLLSHQQKFHKNHSEYLHREILKAELKFDCNECDKKFVAKDILIRHQRSHLYEKYTFLKEESFLKKLKRYKCKLCYFQFREFSKLAEHFDKVHANDQELLRKSLREEDLIQTCVECNLRFVNFSLLMYHIGKRHVSRAEIIHIGEGKLKLEKNEKLCRLCHIKFQNPKFLRGHIRKVHITELDAFLEDLKEEDLKFGCSTCSKKFYTQNTLDFHLKRSHTQRSQESKKSGSYCKLCYYNLQSSSHLQIHKQRVHTSEEEREAFNVKLEPSSLKSKCRYCPEAFLTTNILVRHIVRCHKAEREQQELQCEFCQKSFRWKSNGRWRLKEHMKTVHHLSSYQVNEFGTEKKENVTVKSFMNLMNKLKNK